MPYFILGVSFLFVLLVVRLLHVQVISRDKFLARGNDQWMANTTVSALRGSILDRNENVLAQSATSMTVLIRPSVIQNQADDKDGIPVQQVAKTLAEILEMDENYIYEQAMRDDADTIWIARQVDMYQEQAIRAAALPGVGFELDATRYYIRSNFLSQVLGYTNIDGVGQEGLEAYYNKYLVGVNGQIRVEEAANGEALPFSTAEYVSPVDGYHVVTTIDYVIQSFAEQAAQDAMDALSPESVQIIVMDPDTAQILAMVKKPDMDNNDLPREDLDTLLALSRNTLISDSYEPGSTFKIITSASALDMGVTDTQELFGCAGSVTIDSDTIRCWRHYNPHGTQDLAMALRNSCNPVFVSLALRMGTEDFYGYISDFGFGQRTGIDLYGEAAGIVTNEKYVRTGDLARIGFGQSIAVTPIQMATAVSAVINGGTLMEPYLVSEIVDADGNTVAQFHPTAVRQVIGEDTSSTMRELLQFVVDDGVTAAQIEGVAVGGKTGTAQKYDDNGRIITDAHIASFVGFLPADDPELLVLVVVDGAKTSEDTGSQIAAPIAKTIMEQSYAYLHSVSNTQSDTQYVKVPSIVGLTPTMAQETLAQVGLTLELNGDMEYINSQVPAAGASVPAGSVVAGLADSQGASYVLMPDVTGMKPEEAQAALEAKGLAAEFTGEGRVVSQSVVAGQQVKSGTVIELELD
ncbi:MAG: PASTA domain-containing protein [Clostridia bacterium]|nr:PASTA domain-containing protein [Clostridia bacterium]